MRKQREVVTIEHVAARLRRADLLFSQQQVVGGFAPDFLLDLPDGRKVIVEVKAWNPLKKNIDRAAKQAGYYTAATGVDGTFVVLPGLGRGRPEKGVVGERYLVEFLTKPHRAKAPVGRGKSRQRRTKLAPRSQVRQATEIRGSIFAAMPFKPAYDDVFFVAMGPAAEEVGAVCKRVDFEEYSGDVLEEIQRSIRESKAVIADISESTPNVLYETGFAHALGIPTIHICSTPLDDLPFNVRNWNTMGYSIGQIFRLKARLIQRLRGVLGT